MLKEACASFQQRLHRRQLNKEKTCSEAPPSDISQRAIVNADKTQVIITIKRFSNPLLAQKQQEPMKTMNLEDLQKKRRLREGCT